MRSPNGKIEIVKTRDLVEPGKGAWVGMIEIPGSNFRVANRAFSEPIAFSADSRFLAATELFSDDTHYDGSSRVIVFDFTNRKEIIVYTEKQGSIESLRWTDTTSLCIGAHSHLFGAREHTWKAVR
jgi:hypothetical protein